MGVCSKPRNLGLWAEGPVCLEGSGETTLPLAVVLFDSRGQRLHPLTLSAHVALY